MAKKSTRILVGMTCKVCKNQNYVTEKSKLNTQEAFVFKKYCKKCRKSTEHRENKKLD